MTWLLIEEDVATENEAGHPEAAVVRLTVHRDRSEALDAVGMRINDEGAAGGYALVELSDVVAGIVTQLGPARPDPPTPPGWED